MKMHFMMPVAILRGLNGKIQEKPQKTGRVRQPGVENSRLMKRLSHEEKRMREGRSCEEQVESIKLTREMGRSTDLQRKK